ncbi:MAG: hypothetical protein M1839_004150 [Geoglossum umbratile]|nr:MAG: hypothetical protein M1839_004150 [Geoglossum umbratile]
MDAFNCLIHPHHASLMEPPHSLKSFLLRPADPYYAIDGHSHRGLLTPKFNVTETAGAFFVEGELPGVQNKGSVSVEWLANRTLIIRGKIPENDLEAEWGLEPTEGAADDQAVPASAADKAGKSAVKDKKPRRWLSERHYGEFERSFTFSHEVKTAGMKAKLENGVLGIMVPKISPGEGSVHKITVE